MTKTWTKKFWKPVKPKGSKPIETLVHARAYMLGMPRDLGAKPEWQRASEALTNAAKENGDAHTARAALVEALYVTDNLDTEAEWPE